MSQEADDLREMLGWLTFLNGWLAGYKTAGGNLQVDGDITEAMAEATTTDLIQQADRDYQQFLSSQRRTAA